jgi:hypothetical protein
LYINNKYSRKLGSKPRKRKINGGHDALALAGAMDSQWFDRHMAHEDAVREAGKVKRNGHVSKRVRRAMAVAEEVTPAAPASEAAWPRARDKGAPQPPNLTKAWV